MQPRPSQVLLWLHQLTAGSCPPHSGAARKAGMYVSPPSTYLTLPWCILGFFEGWALYSAFEYFSTLLVIDKSSLEKCKLQKGCGCLRGGRCFLTWGRKLFLCLQGACEGPEESADEASIAHFFTEDWRWRSLWTTLPVNPTAAKEIIFLHILKCRGPDYKPSPCDITPFPKQFSCISTQMHLY